MLVADPACWYLSCMWQPGLSHARMHVRAVHVYRVRCNCFPDLAVGYRHFSSQTLLWV